MIVKADVASMSQSGSKEPRSIGVKLSVEGRGLTDTIRYGIDTTGRY